MIHGTVVDVPCSKPKVHDHIDGMPTNVDSQASCNIWTDIFAFRPHIVIVSLLGCCRHSAQCSCSFRSLKQQALMLTCTLSMQHADNVEVYELESCLRLDIASTCRQTKPLTKPSLGFTGLPSVSLLRTASSNLSTYLRMGFRANPALLA